jgi:hypothetical protein
VEDESEGMKDDICVNKSAEIEIDTDACVYHRIVGYLTHLYLQTR